MTTKQPDFTDLNSLAIEACDMWQEHLTGLANDPAARAELTRFLEPQRRLFADWVTMMQQPGGGSHDNFHSAKAASSSTSGTVREAAAPAVPPSGVAASGDDSLRVAQLALRVAELEKRIARLESRIGDDSTINNAAKPGAARRTQHRTS